MLSFLIIDPKAYLVNCYQAAISSICPLESSDSPAIRASGLAMIGALTLLLSFVPIVAAGSDGVSHDLSAHSENISWPIIQRVVVEPQNVFGAKEITKSRLLRTINRFHITTRKSVILRESLLKVGDVFDPELALETERILRDLRYIYQATVTLDTTNPLGVTLLIQTVDRWSLSTALNISRRSERNLFSIGLSESNLLGHGQALGFTYTVFKPDPSFLRFSYLNPRVLGSFNEFDVNVNDNPFAETKRLTFQRRFIHQSDAVSYRISYLDFRQRNIDVTSVGDTAATFFQDGGRIDLGFAARTGDYHRKLTASIVYLYKEADVRDLTTFNGYIQNASRQLLPPASLMPADSFALPQDSALHEIAISLGATRFDFYQEKRISYQRRVEDVTIINGIDLRYGQGRDREFGRQLYSIWRVTANYGLRVSDLILSGFMRRTGWIKGGGEIRKSFSSELITYFNRIPWVTFAGRTRFAFDKRRENPNPLSVDGVSGVRGYPANFISGNKLLLGNFESRLFSGINVLTAGLGFALHFDFGAAWGDEDKFGLNTFVWSAGPGLRIDLGQVGTIRLDFSYVNSLNKWEISAATGQFFDLRIGG